MQFGDFLKQLFNVINIFKRTVDTGKHYISNLIKGQRVLSSLNSQWQHYPTSPSWLANVLLNSGDGISDENNSSQTGRFWALNQDTIENLTAENCSREYRLWQPKWNFFHTLKGCKTSMSKNHTHDDDEWYSHPLRRLSITLVYYVDILDNACTSPPILLVFLFLP